MLDVEPAVRFAERHLDEAGELVPDVLSGVGPDQMVDLGIGPVDTPTELRGRVLTLRRQQGAGVRSPDLIDHHGHERMRAYRKGIRPKR